jgi:hypothetical protein
MPYLRTPKDQNHRLYGMIGLTVIGLVVLVFHPEQWAGVAGMLAIVWVPPLLGWFFIRK